MSVKYFTKAEMEMFKYNPKILKPTNKDGVGAMAVMNPVVDEYVASKLFDTKLEKNANRKQFILRFNEIIAHIALVLSDIPEISQGSIEKFLSGRYLFNKSVIQRYLENIKNSGIYDFDEYTKTIRLPKSIYEAKVEYEKNHPKIEDKR